MGDYKKMSEAQKKAAHARSMKWRKDHPEKAREIAREHQRRRRAGLAKPRKASDAEVWPLLVDVAPVRQKTVKELEYADKHNGWRLVHQYGEVGTEIRVWIRGIVVKYEYCGSHTFNYANLFDDSGRRYKSATEAMK